MKNNSGERRRERKEEGLERQEKYNALSTKQKIDLIESRPGNSKKELEKLLNKNESTTNKKNRKK